MKPGPWLSWTRLWESVLSGTLSQQPLTGCEGLAGPSVRLHSGLSLQRVVVSGRLEAPQLLWMVGQQACVPVSRADIPQLSQQSSRLRTAIPRPQSRFDAAFPGETEPRLQNPGQPEPIGSSVALWDSGTPPGPAETRQCCYGSYSVLKGNVTQSTLMYPVFVTAGFYCCVFFKDALSIHPLEYLVREQLGRCRRCRSRYWPLKGARKPFFCWLENRDAETSSLFTAPLCAC